jgi:hypothetical protein
VLAACWALEVAGNANGVSVDLAQEQIEKSLEVDLDKPVSCQQLVELHEHYGWPSYWTSSPLSLAQVFDICPGTRAGEAEELKEAEEPHSEPSLRRAREVMRYHVKASDGEIGLVKDLFVDDENWAIRYLLVDTGSWLSRHQVLMASDWIEQVDLWSGNTNTSCTSTMRSQGIGFDVCPPCKATSVLRRRKWGAEKRIRKSWRLDLTGSLLDSMP